MRKRLSASPQSTPRIEPAWLDLDSLATVEVTSESKDHPVEFALLVRGVGGWRAAQPGSQIIRLLFDRVFVRCPQSLGVLRAVFHLYR
jgi:hypothetical protein